MTQTQKLHSPVKDSDHHPQSYYEPYSLRSIWEGCPSCVYLTLAQTSVLGPDAISCPIVPVYRGIKIAPVWMKYDVVTQIVLKFNADSPVYAL